MFSAFNEHRKDRRHRNIEKTHPVMKMNIEQRSIRCFRCLINIEKIENIEMAYPVKKINIEQTSIRCFLRLINIEEIENIETSKWHIPNEDKQRTKIDSMFSMFIFITGCAISMFRCLFNTEQTSIRCFRRLTNIEKIENIETSKWHIL
jgi:hypothetical protein